MPPVPPRSPALRLLDELPALEGLLGPARPRPRAAWSLHAPGLPRGGLVHLDGPAATEAVLQLIAEHPGERAAWVEARLSAYPPGFVQRGILLDLLLFVEAGGDFPWALAELVRSQVFRWVAVASPLPDARALRRLQLSAERAACTVLLASPLPGEAWPVRTRLWCARDAERLAVSDVPAAADAPLEGAGA